MQHSLTPFELKQLEPELDAERARRRLSPFCARMDSTYELAPHAKAMIEHLEALERRDINKLIVTLPPRHGKTYHVSERFPAWYVGRNPKHQVILASYGAELAEQSSRKARDLLLDTRWPFEVGVSEASAAVQRWSTTHGGTLVAAGVGGALTGFGADLLVIDDAVKSREDAESELQQAKTWDWFGDVARTRLMPRGAQLVAGTRWHENDLIGRLMASPGASTWTVLELRAIAEEDDVLKRPVGQALWPERFDLDSYPSVALGEMSSRSFAALYQQRPLPATGGTFKKEWLERRYKSIAALPRPMSVVLAVDGAWKTGLANDFSVIAVWATDGIDAYVIDIVRERMEYPELRKRVQHTFAHWNARFVVVEAAASGLALIADLKKSTKIPVFGANALGSKETRAEAVTRFFESGKVLLPESAPWLEEWISEHLRFPGAKHDDQVDTTSLILPHLMRQQPKPRTVQLFDHSMSNREFQSIWNR